MTQWIKVAAHIVPVGIITFLIYLIWGPGGDTGYRFVTWWCHVTGVKDTQAIQTASGVFAGGSLLVAIVWAVSLTLALFEALDHASPPS